MEPTPQVRIRAGRSWRLNPAYRRMLAGSEEAASGPLDEVEVLDVLTVEVEGVELTAGIREDQIFRVVADLTRAAERLARGRPKAAVAFGAPPAELLLVRRGAQVLVSLVRMGPPPQVPVRDLEISPDALFGAVRECVEALLHDLREVSPEAAAGAWGQSLTRSLRRLRSRWRPPQVPSPSTGSPVRALRGPQRTAAGDLGVAFELLDDGDQLATFSGDPEGDLHSLLADGRIHLHGRGSTPIARWSGPPFLAFRGLTSEVRDLLADWDEADRTHALHFGEVRLTVDRTTVSGPEGEAPVPLPRLLGALLTATLDFCAVVTRRAPGQRHNLRLQDLERDAADALALWRQLTEGDVEAHRPPGHPARGRAEPRAPSGRPLGPGRLRRLSFRRRWAFDAGPLVPGGVVALGRRLLVAGEDGAFALEPPTGAVAWQADGVRAVLRGPRRTDPVLLLTGRDLDLVTPGGDTAWSVVRERETLGPTRYLRGAGHLLLSPDGRTLAAMREEDGGLAWSFVPPGARTTGICGGPGGVVAATDGGFLYGVDPARGLVRWRVRTGVLPSAPPRVEGGVAAVPGTSPDGLAVALVDALSGTGFRRLDLPVDRLGDPVAFGGRLYFPGQVAEHAVVVVLRPGGGDAVSRLDLAPLRGLPRLAIRRGRIYASGVGAVAAFAPDGHRLWCRTLEEHPASSSAPALATARGVLLAAHEGARLLDPATGEPLGSLEDPGLVGPLWMRASEELDLVLGDDDGAVHSWTLGGHLSVVG